MSQALLLYLLILTQSPIIGFVERVIDGDTIRVRIGDRIETVRYIGVDTPESVHPTRGIEPYGLAASAFNRTLVEGQRVRLGFDVEERDRYGRLLAYVYTDSLFVNAELLRQGYAQVMTVPPNVRHADDFLRLQREAREADRGLWGIEASSAIGVHLARTPEDTDVSTGIDASTVDDTQIVYVTSTGKKYHREACHHLRYSRIPITLAEAKEQGYNACSVCRPPR
ncbi:thermonuclease family protein [Gemmatimonadota bacterium]